MSACNAGDQGLVPGSGRFPWRRKRQSTPRILAYSCVESPMDGGAWWSTVHGVTKSRTRLSDFTSLSQKLEVASGSLCNVTSGENKDAPLYIQYNTILRSTRYMFTRRKCVKRKVRSLCVSDSLRPHGLQPTRLPCPSLSPRVCSNSCPLSRGCHPTMSSSVSPSNTFF